MAPLTARAWSRPTRLSASRRRSGSCSYSRTSSSGSIRAMQLLGGADGAVLPRRVRAPGGAGGRRRPCSRARSSRAWPSAGCGGRRGCRASRPWAARATGRRGRGGCPTGSRPGHARRSRGRCPCRRSGRTCGRRGRRGTPSRSMSVVLPVPEVPTISRERPCMSRGTTTRPRLSAQPRSPSIWTPRATGPKWSSRTAAARRDGRAPCAGWPRAAACLTSAGSMAWRRPARFSAAASRPTGMARGSWGHRNAPGAG